MDNTSIKLRKQTSKDRSYLFQLFTETHTKKLQLHALPLEIASTILEQQFHAQTAGYLKDFPDALYHIIEQEGQAIGRIIILENQEYTHIIDLAISERYQGQAIGTDLIQSIISEATINDKSVILNVDELTGPVALYQKIGFKALSKTAGSIFMQHNASNSL